MYGWVDGWVGTVALTMICDARLYVISAHSFTLPSCYTSKLDSARPQSPIYRKLPNFKLIILWALVLNVEASSKIGIVMNSV